ncbi:MULTISPECIES: hypothetical protein [Leisingera]|uniref:hypothetical protein n=1 Tax=Leisingera TaxID=191028 RepID=UPI0012EB8F59|nr:MULTISPECIES: hypothetical protein [Leisingera]
MTALSSPSPKKTTPNASQCGQSRSVPAVEARYRFVNLLGDDGTLLSGEFQGSSREWYRGHWFDPFEVEVLA